MLGLKSHISIQLPDLDSHYQRPLTSVKDTRQIPNVDSTHPLTPRRRTNKRTTIRGNIHTTPITIPPPKASARSADNIAIALVKVPRYHKLFPSMGIQPEKSIPGASNICNSPRIDGKVIARNVRRDQRRWTGRGTIRMEL